MAETATDLAVILGAPLAELVVALKTFRLKNSSGLAAAQVRLGGVDLFFHPSTRNMTIVSRRDNAVVYHRSIAHPKLDGNFRGLRTLQNAAVVHEIKRAASNWCENRPRFVWLQSGYHDIAHTYAVKRARTDRENQTLFRMHEWIEEVSPFLAVPEGLARGGGVAWLSRHSGQDVWIDVAAFERSMRQTVLPARPANWDRVS